MSGGGYIWLVVGTFWLVVGGGEWWHRLARLGISFEQDPEQDFGTGLFLRLLQNS